MNRLLITGAVLVAGAVALAGCGGAGNMSSSGAGQGNGGTATVSAKQLGSAGSVLVDRSGKPLYQNNVDTRGMAACNGACLSFWVPLTVSGQPTGNSITGKLGILERPNGTRQVTLNGKPLYSFSEDSPGKVTGNGFVDAFGGQKFTWHVVHSSGVASSSGGTTTSSGGYGY
jgi:predicted lipoprotein with Yx(FWY)xxD motif